MMLKKKNSLLIIIAERGLDHESVIIFICKLKAWMGENKKSGPRTAKLMKLQES